jgi:hypothetical protein
MSEKWVCKQSLKAKVKQAGPRKKHPSQAKGKQSVPELLEDSDVLGAEGDANSHKADVEYVSLPQTGR